MPLMRRELSVLCPRCVHLGVSFLKTLMVGIMGMSQLRILIPHWLIQQIFVEYHLKAGYWAHRSQKKGLCPHGLNLPGHDKLMSTNNQRRALRERSVALPGVSHGPEKIQWKRVS